MTSRTLLRSQISAAWQRSIEQDYSSQRINSERSLQASLWANLNLILPSDTRRMFIEPGMSVLGSPKKCFPDIVICNTRSVIGIIELKYQPRAQPSWEKDLSTFHWITENREHITISNMRFRGISSDTRSYPLAETILYVWAGVHAACNLNLRGHINPDASKCFLSLHAETQHNEPPKIRSA
jgi:hypothetical protein